MSTAAPHGAVPAAAERAAPKPQAKWRKWIALILIALAILVFAIHKLSAPSVGRAEDAIKENRLDDAAEILRDLEGEQADALRTYVDYQNCIDAMSSASANIQGIRDEDGSSLKQIMSDLENEDALWAAVAADQDLLSKELFQKAEHEHQVLAELDEMEADFAIAHEDMVKMVQGVDFVRSHVQSGIDGIVDSFAAGEERTLMEESRQAGERLAPIIEKWSSLTVKPDYDAGTSEVSGDIPYLDNFTQALDALSGGNDFDALFTASTMTYHFVSNSKGGGDSDDDMVYYVESDSGRVYLSSLEMLTTWRSRFGKEDDETVEDLDLAVENSLDLIRNEAVVECFSQLQSENN